jgi:hypothetical protein
MKLSEMNARQQKAFRNILHAANFHIGGLENGMLDNPEGSQAYNDYKAGLSDHQWLVDEIYRMATTEIYDEGGCSFGKCAESIMKDVRFCGKTWLMERVEARVAKLGY